MYFEPKTIKNYNFMTFAYNKIINFSHILSDYKNVYTVTPQFYLSCRKRVPHITKIL